MLRFKHFSGPSAELEQAVNQWLSDFEPDVTQMVQTGNDDGSLNISFLFEESFRGQERRLSAGYGGRSAPPAASMPDKPLQVPVEPGDPVDQSGLAEERGNEAERSA
jgi:hypothetical protein